jgi:hypothetical protein
MQRYHYNIMKKKNLRLDLANKPSPMSEGVVEIWINSQTCKDINLTTWHMQAQRAPWVVTVQDVIKKPGRVLPRPSAVLHVYASANTPWVARALSHCTPVKWGKVPSKLSTHDATQFVDSICPICVRTFQMLVHLDPTDAGLNWHKRGVPPWSSEF